MTVPLLPGCISEGDTFEQAQRNIKEAIELHLETTREKSNSAPDYQETVETFAVPVQV